VKNSEDAIEKVLTGLRDADAPAGMERRILEAVENRASARSRRDWRKWRSIWLLSPAPLVAGRPVIYGVALAAVFTFALVIPAIHRHKGAPAQTKITPAAGTPTSRETLPPAPSVVVAKDTQLPATVPSRARSKRKINARRAGLAPARDSIAQREMRAASRPAPPLPLTEQEKLLVQFVQTHSRQELAAVNPMKWAARDAEEKAEFDNFFGLPTKGRSE
jgi:hypothetical protein